MPQGTVAWYDTDKGFGFLVPDDGSPDVFVHVSEVAGGQPLQEGEPVAFEVRQGDRGPQAVDVRPLGEPRRAAPGDRAAAARPGLDGPAYGTVTWFAADKGFGFVAPDDGGPDVFVHVSAVEEGVQLRDGDRVELEVRQGDRGPQAEQVRLLDEDPGPGEVVRLLGTVSWFSPDKGFGFLVPDDLFVHGSAVAGPAQLQEGERVEFEVRLGERGPQAEQVRVVGGAPARQRPAPQRPSPPHRPAPQPPQGRLAGTVARWDGDRGFGFLTPDDGSGDVFVHVRALAGDGASGLQEGERVEFDVVQGPRGLQAADVRRTP